MFLYKDKDQIKNFINIQRFLKVHIQKEKIPLKFENINVRVNSTHFFLSLQNIYNTSVQFEVKEYGKFMISFFWVLFSPDDVEFLRIL